MTALIVLAGGTSSRFAGGNKLLASLNGRPILQHVIDIAAPIDFAARYCVYSDVPIRALLEPAGFSCIHNPRPEDGQGVSLSLGVKAALQEGHDSALVLLGDMPFVEADHLALLMDAKDDVVMSKYDGTRQPPALFRGAALKALASLFGDIGAKSAINPANVKTITLSQSAARDIDTREDLDTAS